MESLGQTKIKLPARWFLKNFPKFGNIEYGTGKVQLCQKDQLNPDKRAYKLPTETRPGVDFTNISWAAFYAQRSQ